MSERRSSRPAQRWPDVMIGVLTLALLGGFGTLLLNQHKPVEVAQSQPKPVTTIPASPGTVPEPLPVAPVSQPQAAQPSNAPGTAQPGTAQPNTAQQPGAGTKTAPSTAVKASATPTPSPTTGTANPSATAAPQTTAAAPTSAASSPTTANTDPALAPTTEIPPVPKEAAPKPIAPPVLPGTPAAAPAQTATTAAAPAPTQAAQPGAAQTAPTQTTPAQSTPANPPAVRRAGGAVATSDNRTPLRSDYRISLGSFSTTSTVNSQTAAVDALGYKVHAINLGDQYVAQVGPFADEASARQALADIQRAYPGALLYRPKAKASAAADNSSGTDNAANSADSSETRRAGRKVADSKSSDTPSDNTPAAPSGPTYLQVGAFDRVESAQQLVGTLKDAGFAPTVNNPPDHKTTVMVGPYSGGALRRAEARLDSAGLDHFRVR